MTTEKHIFIVAGESSGDQHAAEYINAHRSINYSITFYLLALFIALMPILPSGNFFNNWISIVGFFPVGFYLLSISKYNEH